MKINYKTNPKKEVLFYNRDLDTNTEYSLEELTKLCKDYWKDSLELHKEDMKRQGYTVNRYTIQALYESGYYNDGYTQFRINYYRSETDKEYSIRLEREQKYKEKADLDKKAAEARAFTKKKEQEKLMKDPEYLKLLELKEKFKGK